MKFFLLLLSIIYLEQVNSQNIISTIAGNGIAGLSGDGGQATSAELNGPTGLAFDAYNNLYIADLLNNCVRKINTSGVITTIAGNGIAGFSGDGGQATSAKLSWPTAVAFDTSGNLYIADHSNNRIRMVNSAGIISTVAGNGTSGNGGDGGLAISAALSGPIDITFDKTNNLYIADHLNHKIRMVNTAGIISTIAGNGINGFSGDGGQASLAKLYYPEGVSFDTIGNLYIADLYNARIRKVDASGIITTVVGNGTSGYSGDGGLATMGEIRYPYKVTFDKTNYMHIVDFGNNRMRMVNNSSILTTFSGNGVAGFSGDGGAAINAELNGPAGVAFDTSGNMYVSDYYNNRIRMITSANITFSQQLSYNNEKLLFYPNPTNDQFYIETNSNDKLNVDLYDVNGRHVFSKSVRDKSNINVATLSEGVYTMTIKTADRVINRKLIIIR